MADRIFPNRFQEDPLDSDLVFQGIDWDNFNQRLAEANEPKENKGLKALIDSIGDEEIDRLQGEDHEDHDEASMDSKSGYMKEAKKGLPAGLKKWMEENGKGKKKSKDSDDDDKDSENCPDCDCDPCECDEEKVEKGPMKRKGPKPTSEKKAYHFNHASQLSAEAVEAAVAAGDENLKGAILAARHDRRVRLAGKIERQVTARQESNLKLAQRRAYREALVQKVAAKMDDEKEASMDKNCEKCGGVYAGKGCEACGYASDKSEMKEAKAFSSAARKAFAAKALAEGFPIEYINARLGETSAPAADKLSNIKNVLASGLETNVKVAAASSMIKVATLSDADYSRIVDYWKNELGYGDQDWIDALFTKKYDKK
jgi:predicted  nucleic acid-binding Zn-ribbon protein